MRPKTYDVDLIDVDTDGIAESQTPAAGGSQSLTLDGALCDLGTAGAFDVHDAGYSAGIGGVQIGIASVGNDTGRTFTITGTNQDGAADTEDVTGANADTAESTKYWRTITSITVDNDTAAAVSVGPVDEASTPTIPTNWRAQNPTAIFVDVTGTINYTVQEFFGPIQGGETIAWSAITAFSAKTADVKSTATAGSTAIRCIVNSYSSGGELQMYVSQSTGC